MTHLQVLQLALGLCVLLLAYAYVLFPLAASLFGSRPARRDMSGGRRDDELPRISLIIPAYNEETVIESKIRNSLEIDYPPELLEILVVGDGVEDATVEIAHRFQSDRLHVLACPTRRGKASVINDAVERSSGDILLMCDANVMFAPDAVRYMVEHFRDAKVGAVSGDVQLKSEDASFGLAESLYYRMERQIHCSESRLGAMMGVDGGMYMVRRELFQPLAIDTILDDFTVSMRVLAAKRDVVYEPQAVASENATETAASEFKRRIRIGAGASQILSRGIYPSFSRPLQLWLFVSHKVLRWISPWLLLCVFALLTYLSVHDSRYQLVLAVSWVIVLLAVTGAVVPALRKYWIVSVPFYFLMSQAAMGVGMVRGILFHQDAIWERTDRSRKKAIAGADSHFR